MRVELGRRKIMIKWRNLLDLLRWIDEFTAGYLIVELIYCRYCLLSVITDTSTSSRVK
jgi:hypothetical protein